MSDFEIYYVGVQLSRQNVTSSQVTTTHSATLHRVAARSEDEARGVAFSRALAAKKDFNVTEIMVMRHDERAAQEDIRRARGEFD